MHKALDHTNQITESVKALLTDMESLQQTLSSLPSLSSVSGGSWVNGLTVFILACFVGYYVVWRVTPALHSPLMAVTNAISSVVIVGALLALGLDSGGENLGGSSFGGASTLGFIGVFLASVNIFGGFVVTKRMLAMFMKSK